MILPTCCGFYLKKPPHNQNLSAFYARSCILLSKTPSPKIDMPTSVTYIDPTPIFMWHVVRWVWIACSKHEKYTNGVYKACLEAFLFAMVACGDLHQKTLGGSS